MKCSSGVEIGKTKVKKAQDRTEFGNKCGPGTPIRTEYA